MGDVSAEPSMEDILSSIKRIIAEEDVPKTRRSPPPTSIRAVDESVPEDEDTILELSDPIAERPAPVADETTAAAPAAAIAPVRDEATTPTAGPGIVSDQTASVTRNALDALSKLMVKPEPASDGTLEGLVRELLRPILREWIDANLPGMVETMVQREIAKITGTAR